MADDSMDQKSEANMKTDGKINVRRGNNAPLGYIFFRINQTIRANSYRDVFQNHAQCLLLIRYNRERGVHPRRWKSLHYLCESF